MIFSLTKNTTRFIFWILVVLSTLILGYVLGGYKYYSILENNEKTIIDQAKNRFDVDIKYSTLNETWRDLIPGIKLTDVILKDKNGNSLNASKFDIKLDILALIIENKVKIKRVVVDDVILTYNQPEDIGINTNDGFELSILEKINIEEIKFKNFNFNYVTPNKTYELKNLSLNYKEENDYVVMVYNNLNIYQYINKNLSKSKTVVRGNIKDIEDTIKRFEGQKYLDMAQYNKIYKVDGKVRVEVNVSKIDDKWDYDVVVNIPDNTVYLLEQNLTFTNFKGNIYYSKEKSLYTDNMVCQINGHPCKFSISNKSMSDIYFNFEAFADKKLIDKYTPFFKNTVIDGGSMVSGVYRSREKYADTLKLKTNLFGVSISELPLFNKTKESTFDLNIDLNFSKTNEYLDLYGEGLQVFVDLKDNDKTQIFINKEKQKFSKINENLLVSASVSDIDVDSVLNFINTLKFKEDNKKDIKNSFIYKLNIDGKNIKYLNQNFDDVKLTNNKDILDISVNDSDFIGNIIYDLSKNSMKGQFDKFYYVVDTESETNSLNESFKINEIPEMNMVVKDIKIKNYSGELSFNGRHVDNGYVIDNLQGAINGLSPNFIIKISQDFNDIETSIVSINDNKLIEFGDIGDILSYYGYSNTMTSEKGIVYGNLYWKGLVPSMANLNGVLHFELINGRINAASAGQKVLNVFRIFEVNTLNQMFRMDFDIIKSGIQYDSLIGGGEFNNGNFEINKETLINMKSKSFNSSISGNINFKDETFNNKIKVDLPVSQKLPAIALIAGGPAAAAGIWVVDKMVGDKLNSLMSIKFGIKGSFIKPETF